MTAQSIFAAFALYVTGYTQEVRYANHEKSLAPILVTNDYMTSWYSYDGTNQIEHRTNGWAIGAVYSKTSLAVAIIHKIAFSTTTTGAPVIILQTVEELPENTNGWKDTSWVQWNHGAVIAEFPKGGASQ